MAATSITYFFFSSRRRHTRYWRDWSSDVCSSDLLNKLELEIATTTDVMKEQYAKASHAMPDGKSYFLSGVQTGPVVKSYLLTRQGVEVPGEQIMQIPEFIETVLRFANYPKRKIEIG